MDNEVSTRGHASNWELEENELDLADILLALWRKKILIAAITLTCAACAFIYLAVSPRSYESKTTLLFFPTLTTEIAGSNTNITLTPDTYVTLATANDLISDVIASAYADTPQAERPSVGSIRNRLNITLTESAANARDVPTHMAMTVSFRDGDPERAMNVLNSWNSLFIERNSQLFSDRTGATSELLAKSIETIQGDLKEAEDRLLEYSQEHPVSIMRSQLSSIEKAYSDILSEYEKKMRELPPLEAELNVARELLANEPETKTLTRGMSNEALWNVASQDNLSNRGGAT